MVLGPVFKEQGATRSLKEMINNRFYRKQNRPPFSKTDWIRASSLAHLCARQIVLANASGTSLQDYIDPNLLFTFLHGTSLHWGFQNRLGPALGILLGKWRCTFCGKRFGGASDDEAAEVKELKGKLFDEKDRERFRHLMKRQIDIDNLILRPTKCSACGAAPEDENDEWSPFEYEEQWFGEPDLRVGGHPDGFLRLPWLPGIGLLEVKSIADAFRVRNTPDTAHVDQLQVYLRATGTYWAVVFYWSKGVYGTRAIVEHVVKRNDKRWDRISSAATSIWKGIDTGDLPNRECKSWRCSRAQKCGVGALCFGERMPEKAADVQKVDL